ncbi:MAG: LLM class flavin-dependent oxidoreductase [Gammaproteobacteria bacterium]|nr:LLM class flavin-dependent oxidoreductase [Gammaproteobacteria bacterium]
MMAAMRIGISVSSNYDVDDPRQGAAFMVERARAARQADLDSLFVGDHHVTRSPYYQNSPILGRMLGEWGDKPAGALYLLPLWHPVLLAEQVATLASIAEGPFIMQCGLGGDKRQSAGMGVSNSRRAAMFEASLEALRALWRGEEVTLERFWPVQRARISPLPPQPVDVWVGALAVPAINRTARLAEGWLASPGLTRAGAADALNVYRQACAEHGREPGAVAIRRDVFVGRTSQEARAVVQPYVQQGYRGFPEEALLTGSVAEVADELAAFRELGYTDVIVRNISTDQGEALATIERLAAVKAALQ